MFQGCSGVVPGLFRAVPGCSGGVPGVFRGVPGCSGVFRVCSGFYRHPSARCYIYFYLGNKDFQFIHSVLIMSF